MADETQKTLIDITALKYFYKSLQNVTVLIAPSSIEAASASNLGRTYFIPVDGTYAGVKCSKGDHIVSNGVAWILIPKGTSEGGKEYFAGQGIDISTVDGKDVISNTGVRKIGKADESHPGTIKVSTGNNNPEYIEVAGLDTAAFMPYETELTEDSDDAIPTSKAVADYVADEIAVLTVADSEVEGQYVASVAQKDGKITINRQSLPTSLPASDVTDEYDKDGTVPVSGKAVASAISGKLDANQKGASGGVAELDENGKVLSSQLPSYVDDVVEASSKSAFPTTGESGKIYVDTTANLTYRWTGTAYTEISPSIALGETASTAFRGDHGKTAYDHATTTATNPHNTTKADVGLGNVGNFKAVSTVASQGLTDTEKSNARTNIGAGTYSKASTGIPKTDLASAVQTSLGLADTALQKHQDISGKENTANKVSAWQSTPDNTHYPTEKLVKDNLDGKVPTTRKVNGKALSADVTLSGADVAVTGYAKASTASAIAATDTVNVALGKVEKALDGKAASSHNQASNTITAMTGYSAGTNKGAIAATDSLNVAIAKLENTKACKTSVSLSKPDGETTSVINVTDAKAQMAMVAKISGKTQKVVQKADYMINQVENYTLGANVARTAAKFTYKQNHVYMMSAICNVSNIRFQTDGKYGMAKIDDSRNTRVLKKFTCTYADFSEAPYIYNTTSSAVNITGNFLVFDLTEMGIPTVTEAEFGEMFPNNYYARTDGTLFSAPVESVVSQGSNLVDTKMFAQGNVLSDGTEGTSGSVNTWNGARRSSYIEVESSKTYNIVCDDFQGSKSYIIPFDANKKMCGSEVMVDVSKTYTTPANTKYIRITIYKNGSNWGSNGFPDNFRFSFGTGNAYAEYVGKTTVLVPQSIRNLPDYGVENNIVDFENGTYTHNNTISNGAVTAYTGTDKVIPISDYLRPLPVENGGTLTLVNEHNLDMPSVIKYKKEV